MNAIPISPSVSFMQVNELPAGCWAMAKDRTSQNAPPIPVICIDQDPEKGATTALLLSPHRHGIFTFMRGDDEVLKINGQVDISYDFRSLSFGDPTDLSEQEPLLAAHKNGNALIVADHTWHHALPVALNLDSLHREDSPPRYYWTRQFTVNCYDNRRDDAICLADFRSPQ